MICSVLWFLFSKQAEKKGARLEMIRGLLKFFGFTVLGLTIVIVVFYFNSLIIPDTQEVSDPAMQMKQALVRTFAALPTIIAWGLSLVFIGYFGLYGMIECITQRIKEVNGIPRSWVVFGGIIISFFPGLICGLFVDIFYSRIQAFVVGVVVFITSSAVIFLTRENIAKKMEAPLRLK